MRNVSNVSVLNNDMQQNVFQVQKNVFEFQTDEKSEIVEDIQTITTETTESITCTSFNIPREASIPSDNKPHKVTISNLQFQVEYSYTVIPKLSLNAYLKANIRNSGKKKVPLLGGEINVFMDNNFVTKSKIQNIVPGESFSIFLGIDSSIKIDYRPVKKNTESTGLLKKSNFQTVIHETVITNNKNIPVKMVMYDQLPKSDISNIKVKLIEPELESENNPGKESITPANNIKWKFDLEPKDSVTKIFKYTLEYPKDQEIEFT